MNQVAKRIGFLCILVLWPVFTGATTNNNVEEICLSYVVPIDQPMPPDLVEWTYLAGETDDLPDEVKLMFPSHMGGVPLRFVSIQIGPQPGFSFLIPDFMVNGDPTRRKFVQSIPRKRPKIGFTFSYHEPEGCVHEQYNYTYQLPRRLHRD